jgi:DNA (cytosine-5)-methyltransferase 1
VKLLSGPEIRCADLFCGVGGLTHGLSRQGVSVSVGVDLDSRCRYPYEENNPSRFLHRDIAALSGQELQDRLGDGGLRCLAGCAPCQPFSSYSRVRRSSRSDTKWSLVAEFGRILVELSPHLVTVENVPQLASHPVFEELLGYLSGYFVSWSVVDCALYGVPQTRKRLVLLASRLGPVGLLSPAEFGRGRATVRSTIGDLPAVSAGECEASDPLHRAPRLSELNLRRIRQAAPGGSWREWDQTLRASCHQRRSGSTYPSVYGRMQWDAPSPTITTQCFGFGNGRFGHPEQDRAITLREAALLQTFPHKYRFVEPGAPIRFNVLGRLIGNAVPVLLAEVIGRSLVEHVAATRGCKS